MREIFSPPMPRLDRMEFLPQNEREDLPNVVGRSMDFTGFGVDFAEL